MNYAKILIALFCIFTAVGAHAEKCAISAKIIQDGKTSLNESNYNKVFAATSPKDCFDKARKLASAAGLTGTTEASGWVRINGYTGKITSGNVNYLRLNGMVESQNYTVGCTYVWEWNYDDSYFWDSKGIVSAYTSGTYATGDQAINSDGSFILQ